MSSDSNVISLPKGGGALHGIGEKFSPDLHTGTGNFTVPIALPPGRNGFQPGLNLGYSSGNGNGPWGLGWTLSVPSISRKTSHGVPRYNETLHELREYERRDVFILSGAEDLVPVAGRYPGAVQYQPRTEGLFARIIHHRDPDARLTDDYWDVTSKDGVVNVYGTPHRAGHDPAALTKPDDASRVFAWKLTQTADRFGNLIRYDYQPDHGDTDGHRWNQPLLGSIRYADYGDPSAPTFLVSVELIYEQRPDPFSDHRAGFEIRTTRRCTAMRVSTHTADGVHHPVREYRLAYDTSTGNGVSLLARIDIVGFDDDGRPYDGDDDDANPRKKQLPPLTFRYTAFAPARRRFEAVRGVDLPARALGAAEMELVDLNGSGLPDVLEMNGTVRYWRNLGNGRFDRPRPMREAPPHSLADPGVQMIDVNGDGRMDLVVSSGGQAGYYASTRSAGWDRGSFRPYKAAPSFAFDDREVRFVDLDGDGVTDLLRSGSRMECFFNDPDPALAWHRTHFAPRRDQSEFPNVTFSDPRVRLADMTGDGLQDIVLVHDGNVEYWPNLGHGFWGRRVSMRHGPRFPSGYDTRRILIGDVDGDGLADIVYVDHGSVRLWLNQSGNAWSSEPVEIGGTPPVTDMDNVRLIDLYGSGVAGVLWSRDATRFDGERLMFLDFTGGQKPYLLREMDNHMGAVTRVRYRPSTFYYLEDARGPRTRWRTALPFPVQVVAAVDAVDEVSKGTLTTEYAYHHGYWDGAEREFRGFGMVEHVDTELVHDDDGAQRFSSPTLSRTWFHQGPIGEEHGDWEEADYTDEYWAEDPQLLNHTEQVNAVLRGFNDRGPGRMPSPRNRRIKRDALRSLRGKLLRSELYALDVDARRTRPYTVTEHAYGLREEAAPAPGEERRTRIFFPHMVAERATQWERGDDPMTQFIVTDDYDAYGQPRGQTRVAMPRRAAMRRSVPGAVVGDVQPDETRVLASHTRTSYAASSGTAHMHDRAAHVTRYEYRLDALSDTRPAGPDVPGDDVQTVLRKQWSLARQIRDAFASLASTDIRVVSHGVHHYDGRAFEGLPAGELGAHGALVRAETLAMTEETVRGAYGTDVPAGFDDTRLGYRKVAAGGGYVGGWYVDSERRRLDVHAGVANPRGLVIAMRDALGHEVRIDEYEHELLPRRVTDAAGLPMTAAYNYRVVEPERVVDPNGTTTHMRYNTVGLPERAFMRGLDSLGNDTLGGTADKPEVRFVYDFLHFDRSRRRTGTGRPIFVHTTRRIHHASDNRSDDAMESREYSDGFGRLVQTRARTQAWMFGAGGDDVGLPAQAGVAPAPAVARPAGDRVVVSGWQVFDNKGQAIEKYEPFVSRGWDFEPEADARRGQHLALFRDPRGTVVRTVRPDGSQERVVLGRPVNASDVTGAPETFAPTPWESYTYDGNDLAAVTTSPEGAPLIARAPPAHHFTPASTVVDALGRAICQVRRNGADPRKDWFVTRTRYDVSGTPRTLVDPLGRDAFAYVHDLLGRMLRADGIDAGVRASVFDARGNVVESRDSKDSLTRRTYDALNRPKELWARDDRGGALTVRERLHYGDEDPHAPARLRHTLGRPVRQYDDAGLIETPEYDFKGNAVEQSRRTITDTALAGGWVADWNAARAEDALDTAVYQTTTRFDALNRPTAMTWPRGVDGARRTRTATYDDGGALQGLALDGAEYVAHIAYNARGQRVLIAYGNGVMTRQAYDPRTFRLRRVHTQRFTAAVDAATGARTWTGTGATLQDFVYDHDLVGNVTKIDERTPSCGIENSLEGRHQLVRELGYDPVYRLTAATGRACRDIGVPRGLDDDPRCGLHAAGALATRQDNAPQLTERYTEGFVYDPTGNIREVSYQAPSGPWKRVFGMGDVPSDRWDSAPNNRLTTLENGAGIPGHTYRFDDNGNLIQQDTDRHHTWDHADRMVGYRVQAGPGATPSLHARYLHGADGTRIKKWVRNQQGRVDTTVYVGDAFEHHRRTDGGATQQNNTVHVMDDQTRVAVVRVGAPIDPRDATPPVHYHLGDHLGNSHVSVGGADVRADGFINREEYFPYGETSFGSFAKKRYRYRGRERDEESGLTHFRARYLASWLGRWVSSDPLGARDGVNTYAAFAGNPLRFVDPLGTQIEPTPAEVAAEQSLVSTEEVSPAGSGGGRWRSILLKLMMLMSDAAGFVDKVNEDIKPAPGVQDNTQSPEALVAAEQKVLGPTEGNGPKPRLALPPGPPPPRQLGPGPAPRPALPPGPTPPPQLGPGPNPPPQLGPGPKPPPQLPGGTAQNPGLTTVPLTMYLTIGLAVAGGLVSIYLGDKMTQESPSDPGAVALGQAMIGTGATQATGGGLVAAGALLESSPVLAVGGVMVETGGLGAAVVANVCLAREYNGETIEQMAAAKTPEEARDIAFWRGLAHVASMMAHP